MSTATLSDSTGRPLEPEFDQIFRENYQFVLRTAYGVTGSREDAEDILQTIFLRLIRRTFPPDLQKNPRGYLYRAAVNLSLNTIRSRRRQVAAGAEHLEAIGPAIGSNPAEELHQRLYDAIAGLHPGAAEILILRYVHDYSDAEIARLLGTSRGVIAARLFRSRARLRQLIRSSEGEKA